MKTHCASKGFLLVLALAAAALLAPSSLYGIDSSAGSGDVAIYTATAGGEAITTGDFTHSFDATDREDAGSFSRSGTDVALNRSGHYLAIYSSQFNSTGGSNRSEIQSYLSLAGSPLPVGWSQGYIRRANAQDETFTSGFAVFEATATDVLTLHSFRTDSNPGATVARTPNATGLQLVKLDEVHMSYARLSLAANASGPANDTFVPVLYDTTEELGAGFTHASPGELTLVDGGKYLVTANTYINGPADRTALVQQLTLNGTPIEGSTTTVFVRGQSQNSCQDGAAAVGMIINAAANDVLRVQAALDDPDNSSFIGGRCGLAVVKLPDTAGLPAAPPDYIVRTDNTGQNINPASETALSFSTEVETSSAFSHTGGSSAVTVNTVGDYLFFGSAYDPNANSNAGNRAFYSQGWHVNGAPREVTGQTGRYIRGNAAPQVDQYGNASGLITTLAATDTVEMVTVGLATTTNPEPADSLALQGVRLASLFTFDLYGVDSDVSAVAVSEATPTTSVPYNLNLRTATTGTVQVTVTSDGDTEVSMDDANFFPAVTLTFNAASGTTPQTVHVRAVDDGDIEGAHTSIISHAITSSDDPNYPLAKPIPDVEAVVTDNDVTPVDAIDDFSATNTDEDTPATEALLAPQADLLANDLDGVNNSVIAYDATSAQGAAVVVESTGTFTYDPSGSAALQGLAAGEQAIDTFTYTAADGDGNSDTATVSITVDGVNDDPVVVDDAAGNNNGTVTALNLLANDNDVDSSDVLVVSSLAGNAVGTFGTSFTTAQGATVTIAPDGSLSYDPRTSVAASALMAGQVLVEVLAYEMSDGTTTASGSVTITTVSQLGGNPDTSTVVAGSTTNFAVLGNDQVSGAAGSSTAGAVIEFLAENPSNTDLAWFNSGSTSAQTASRPVVGGAASVLNLSPSNAPAGVTAVYDFSGAGSGVTMVDVGDPNFGNPNDAQDATIELLFRPDDLTGDCVLWETGGNGTGMSIVKLGNQLVTTITGNNGPDGAQVVGTLPVDALMGGAFVYAVVLVDVDPTPGVGTVEMLINGVSAGTDTMRNLTDSTPLALNDFSGTDDGGVGLNQGTLGGDIPEMGLDGTVSISSAAGNRFPGEVALFRLYGSLLTPAELSANSDAIFDAPVPAVAADIQEVDGQAVTGAPQTFVLASGAQVTLETDGTFTYDPSGAFDQLGVGFSAIETFSYTLNSSAGGTSSVSVVVTGTNTDPQITISASPASFDEGTSASISVLASAAVSGPVTVNLSYSGAAENPADYLGGVASVQIPDGGVAAPALLLDAIADSLFEGGSENLIVTIDSVVGNAVLGGTLSAQTFINDGDGAPEFSLAGPAGPVAEGETAVFTVSASVASTVPVDIGVIYAATNTALGSDPYVGGASNVDYLTVTGVTLPAGAGSTSVALEVPICPDRLADDGETLELTIDSATLGTIGAADTASATLSDVGTTLVFEATFEGIDPLDTPGGTLTGSDAPFAADLGTSLGSWSNVPVATTTGGSPGVVPDSSVLSTDVKDDGIDFNFRIDRPSPAGVTPPLVYVDTTANFAAPLDFSGSNTGAISFDLGQNRTENLSTDKSSFIRGLDRDGNVSFELFLNADNSSPTGLQLYHSDGAGGFTSLGVFNDFDNTQDSDNPAGGVDTEQTLTSVKLILSSGGYFVAQDIHPVDGSFERVSGLLPYVAGSTATQVNRLVFAVSTSTDDADSGGIMIDDLRAIGVAGNQAPVLSLGGTELADGGSTPLPDSVTGGTKSFDGVDELLLGLADPDSGPGTLTLRLNATAGLGTINVTLAGGTLIGTGTNNSADLTLNGTAADIAATLANGVVYNVGAIAGVETLSLTADDGGNTGAPGTPLTTTHDLIFAISANPLVTIDQAGGQADPTTVESINFTAVFTEDVAGFDGSDLDFTGSTAPGSLSATVTGGPSTYNVEVTGMTGDGDVVVSIPAAAATSTATTNPSEPSTSTDNSVSFVKNLPPVASNIDQTVLYPTGAAAVSIGGIDVSDANEVLSSAISTATTPFVDYPAVDPATSFSTADPSNPLGLSIEVCFTPEAADVATGGAGTENRRIVFNIGGSSNGSGIYMIEGVPHFISKMNSTAPPFDTSATDTDWSTAGMISVPLSGAALPPGVPTKIAMIFSLDAIRFSVNGAAPADVALSNRGTKTNWAGDNSLRIGTLGGPGGLSSATGNLFSEVDYQAMSGGDPAFAYARMFNVSDAGVQVTTPVISGDEITVTLDVDNVTNGTLTATGAGVTGSGTSSLTIVGDSGVVDAALATLQFVPNGSTTSSETISVTVDDGDEDGSPAQTGTITVTQSIIQQWRVDNFGDPSDSGIGANFSDLGDFDSLVNLLEFAFGTDPNLADNLALTVDVNGGTFTPGTPVVNVTFSPLDLTYRFVRRVDYVAAGLTYTPQFTANGVDFVDSTAAPSVVVPDDGSGYEVVEVPFAVFVPGPGGLVKASAALARVQVSLD